MHKKDFDTAIQTCINGAKVLSVHGFESAALELGIHAIEALEKAGNTLDVEMKNQFLLIDDGFKIPESKHRSKFLKACIKLDRTLGQRVLGDPLLHARLAFNLWETPSLRMASTHHFALAEAPDRLASKLEEVTVPLDRDRLMTMGVLHLLANDNLRDANELYKQYKNARIRATTGGSYTKTKLQQFVDYALQTCKRDAAPLFQKLCMAYAIELNFDDLVPALIKGPIAGIYFNIQQKQQSMPPILQQLLGGFQM